MIELTEELLYKLEQKLVALLSDAESMQLQIQRLQQENTALKQEKESHTRKLHDLVSLLDSINPVSAQQSAANAAYAASTVTPILETVAV